MDSNNLSIANAPNSIGQIGSGTLTGGLAAPAASAVCPGCGRCHYCGRPLNDSWPYIPQAQAPPQPYGWPNVVTYQTDQATCESKGVIALNAANVAVQNAEVGHGG